MTAARPRAALVCGPTPSASERSIRQVLEFFEIPWRQLQPGQLDADAAAGDVVLVSASHLGAALERSGGRFLPPAIERAAAILIFDFEDGVSSARALRWTTASPSAAVRAVPPGPIAVANIPELCGPMARVVATPVGAEPVRTFAGLELSPDVRSVMSCAGTPLFLQIRRPGAPPVFACAASLDLDLDRPPPDGGGFDVRSCFAGVVPVALFLKHVFGATIYSRETIRAAFVVDDPALKRRYGYLDFEAVLASMDRHDFATTIAFIPWNFRRSTRRTAELFLKRPDRYSLVVHGCDHTGGEFGSRSIAVLNPKVKVAAQRIERHRQSTGVRVSPIMVFPQGVFSPEAAQVLKRNNFTAAANTEVHPDGAGAPRTAVRELWNGAITQYSSFPIFTRRYMSDGLENFAFDALLGKPCVLVAHHEVFRDGARMLTAFVDALNGLTGGVRWGALDDVVKDSCLFRSRDDGAIDARMFANEARFESAHGATFVVTKSECDREAIASVRCDGREIAWEWADGVLCFRVEVRGAGTVQISYVDTLGDVVPQESASYRLAVRVRRYLSELRDDYICRSDWLASWTEAAMRVVRRRARASSS